MNGLILKRCHLVLDEVFLRSLDDLLRSSLLRLLYAFLHLLLVLLTIPVFGTFESEGMECLNSNDQHCDEEVEAGERQEREADFCPCVRLGDKMDGQEAGEEDDCHDGRHLVEQLNDLLFPRAEDAPLEDEDSVGHI